MRTTSWLTAATVLVLLGCKGGGLEIAQVAGRVTLDGKPLPNATVNFQPIGSPGNINPGSGSYGKTDADGRYTLRTVDQDRDGAYVGKHRVEITAQARPQVQENDRDRGSPNLVPAQYNRESKLTFEVKSGTNAADWPLTSK
jgi:hypothetical protein